MKEFTLKLSTLCKAAVACAMVYAASGCTAVNRVGLASAGNTALGGLMVTNDQLIASVKQQVAQMDAQNKVAPADNPYAQRLSKLTQGLTTTGTVPLNFKVYITKEINAFACPDGSVRVYSGIMDVMDDEELLGIIGHEIGHVAMEHSLNSYKQQVMNSAAAQAIASLDPKIGAVMGTGLGALGTQLLEQGLSSKFSRSQENQADDFGYDFLKGAGRNPYAMVDAFEKMEKLEQSAQSQAQMGSYLQNMFSDHPQTAERIKRMKARCAQDGFTKSTKK